MGSVRLVTVQLRTPYKPYGTAANSDAFVMNEAPKMYLRGNHNNFLDLICDCFSAGNAREADLFCIVVWRIWFCRNSTLHDGKKHKMSKVISWSSSFLQEFQNSIPKSQKAEVYVNRSNSRWRSPEKDTCKANCDAFIDHGIGKMGIGVIIRNSNGNVLASCSSVVDSFFSVKVAKLMAILKCLQFGIDCDLNLGNVETTEAKVVNRLKDGDYLDSDFGLVISDILILLRNTSYSIHSSLAPSKHRTVV